MLDVCEKRTQATSTLKDAHKTYKKLYDDYARRVDQAESGQGIDWKELMQVVRICHEAQELLLDRRITYPRPEAALLLSRSERRGAIRPSRRVDHDSQWNSASKSFKAIASFAGQPGS